MPFISLSGYSWGDIIFYLAFVYLGLLELFFVLGTVLIHDICKISCGLRHKFCGGRLVIVGEAYEEVIRLKRIFALIVYLAESLCYLDVVYFCRTGESMQVSCVVYVMHVERTKAVVTYDSYRVLGLSVTKGNVTDIKANGKVLRVV